MKWRLCLAALVGIVTAFPAIASAQELLTNGGLELTPPDNGGRDAVPPGWTLEEGPVVPSAPGPYPGDYNNGGVVPPCRPHACSAVDAADYVLWRKHLGTNITLPNEGITPGTVSVHDYTFWRNNFGAPYALSMAEPSNFGHLLFEGDWQMWFQPYYGTQAEQEDNFAHLSQTVLGTPGLEYTMSGWALFENFFPGGVDNLNAEVGGTPTGAPFDDGPVSPTDAFFGLDFLDADGDVLPGSVEIELKEAGQLSNTTWQQHTLVGVAPAETVNVRVRATMTDGVYNPLPSPQVFQMSFFVDAFSLTAGPPGARGAGPVPEPASWLLLATAIGTMTAPRRRLPLAPFDRH